MTPVVGCSALVSLAVQYVETMTHQQRMVAVSHARSLCRSGEAKSIRAESMLTLREVALVVGADASTVLRWENGESMPRPEQAVRYGTFIDALRVSC